MTPRMLQKHRAYYAVRPKLIRDASERDDLALLRYGFCSSSCHLSRPFQPLEVGECDLQLRLNVFESDVQLSPKACRLKHQNCSAEAGCWWVHANKRIFPSGQNIKWRDNPITVFSFRRSLLGAPNMFNANMV